MHPSEVKSYLDTFANFESQLHKLLPKDFHLNRIQKFLDLAGNPDQHLKIIHVAGTKGKGSTCAFLAGILQEARYRVGLYTSPHLHRLNERIRILTPDNIRSKDGFSGCITDEELARELTRLRPIAAAIQNKGNILTFFEVVTVAALSYFAGSGVDVVILETGLGGRLDATNAVNSSVAVITPVSLDHTKILGETVGRIAVEKAGIIKNSRQKVVIAPQEKAAMDVILSRCQEFGVQPVLVNPDKYENYKIALKGRHQLINAAAAIEAALILRTMGFKISDEALCEGLKNVRWPGRFELLRRSPDVIVDCAHNEASAQALSATLTEEYPNQRIILILGISRDKDAQAICKHFKGMGTRVILTQARHPRSRVFTQKDGKDFFGDKPFEIIDSVEKSLEKALQIAKPQDVIVVTGSIFVAAEAIRELKACTNTKD